MIAVSSCCMVTVVMKNADLYITKKNSDSFRSEYKTKTENAKAELNKKNKHINHCIFFKNDCFNKKWLFQ